ncbi:MAG: DNA-directed RNA polymerase [Candidatus Lokiarchaeota archaeon]|nr:DNA-directed RNA polymerase [Candidatus Lokiarchaeota archaeon]
MYHLYTLSHIVEIAPDLFGLPKEESAYEILSRSYHGLLDPELGFIIAICDIIDVGPGKIIHGSAGTFHPVTFTVLTYTPLMHEVVEGEVVELVDFGAFIRLGPSDGLCHITQIANDKLNFENVNARFTSADTGRSLEVGDLVRARVIVVSVGSGRSGKIGLTMRQPFLGKLEYIQEEIEEIQKAALEGSTAEKKKNTKSKAKG